MELFIKNMVCDRCTMVVENEFKALGLTIQHIELGKVSILEEAIDSKQEALKQRLEQLGFELLNDKKAKTAERIKNLIIETVHQQKEDLKINLSDYLAEKLNKDYNTLSSIFKEVENSTIEKFFINQRIEKVKELIAYDELNLNEIALLLNYSSVAHLSNQFKKITGLSPSAFKKQTDSSRIALDKV